MRQLVNVIRTVRGADPSPVISDALVEQALEGKIRRCQPLLRHVISLN
ncbi:hypothetical protein ACLK1T_20535 [Escherichia coli]